MKNIKSQYYELFCCDSVWIGIDHPFEEFCCIGIVVINLEIFGVEVLMVTTR